jgi:hypothetical protein
MRINVIKALKKFKCVSLNSMVKELFQLHNRVSWEGKGFIQLFYAEERSIISSQMCLCEKYTSIGEWEKLKARLVS